MVKDGEDVVELRRICIHSYSVGGMTPPKPTSWITPGNSYIGSWSRNLKGRGREAVPQVFPQECFSRSVWIKLMAAVAFSYRSIYLPFIYVHVLVV